MLIITIKYLYLHIINSQQNKNAMTKDEILELIRNEEAELYFQLLELREMYGVNDRSTKHAGAQWNAITTILDKIEENEKADK